MKEEIGTLLEMMRTIIEITSPLKTEEAMYGVFKFATETIMDVARDVKN